MLKLQAKIRLKFRSEAAFSSNDNSVSGKYAAYYFFELETEVLHMSFFSKH